MPLTLTDVMERLKQLDEVTLLEVLQVSSEDLIQRFIDRIEDNYEELERELND